MLSDLRLALRSLRKNPRFTLLAVAVLALGIGANAAIFSVVYSVMLRPLPFPDPDSLVMVWNTSRTNPTESVSPPEFRDFQKAQSFTSMAAAYTGSADLTGDGAPEQIGALQVDGELFRVIGQRPLLGRAIEPQDARGHVVVLTHRFWQRRLGGDVKILGQKIRLSGIDYEVVGVMPPSFRFPPFWAVNSEIYMPMNMQPSTENTRGAHFMRIFARLKPGITVEQASAEMRGIAAGMLAANPDMDPSASATVIPLAEMVVGKVRRTLLVLLGAVGFLLLIACVNVANLVLARATSRSNEVAVRIALGAGPWRLARQLLAETAVLSAAGCGAGILLAGWCVSALRNALAERGRFGVPRAEEISLYAPVLLFCVSIAALTCLLCGLAPAIQAWRSATASSLGDRSGTGARARLREVFVIAEIALALMLVTGGGLTVRSFLRLSNIDPGFTPAHALTATVSATGARYREPGARPRFFAELLARLNALPGVTAAGAINHLPLVGDEWNFYYTVDGAEPQGAGKDPGAIYRVADPGYFAAMGIPIVGGRAFTDRDSADSPRVLIVNQAFAKRAWPGQSAIGHRVRLAENNAQWMTVVGVVRDVRQSTWAETPAPEMYRPYAQDSQWRAMGLVIRTAGDPAALMPAVERTVWAVDRNLPLADLAPLSDAVDAALRPARISMLLLASFGALALLLAAAGIYGVMAYVVECRTREIGIRMALGAGRADVTKMVAGRALALSVAGVACGAAASLALSRLLEGLLYETRTDDPATFALVAAGVTLIAVAASWAPARRASTIDPALALRAT